MGRSEQSGREPNRLIHCSSPYLQQHAHNPVDWYPWGQEAIERARREDKPILLSIGYSACHWCHVMERESFEDPQVAALMNELFVNIKVDREERPDLDELHMRAVQLMTGSGGWPLTVFLTPDLVPFYGGTYYPPQERGGLPSFPAVMRAVSEAYAQRRGEVLASAQEILEAIRRSGEPPEGESHVTEAFLEAVLRSFSAQFDLEHGGFGVGTKFPQAATLDFLLRFWAWSGDDRPLFMVRVTLDKMAAGGIFDQVGGGFHRYSVDRKWRVPHFEKMLYDNAQLAGLYADAFRATGEPAHLRTAVATADYVLRELRSPEGAFYSSQDADSEGEEGTYYVWTYDQIIECLGEDEGKVVARYLGAAQEGNWTDGRNVLCRPLSLRALAGLSGRSEEEAQALVEWARQALFERRRQRVGPEADRKVLAGWNSLMVSALVRLGRATGTAPYLEAARGCAEFVLAEMARGGSLMHAWRDGAVDVPGFLSDYALLSGALLDLYESTFEVAYLRRARELAAVMLEDYWDAGAGTFAEAGRRNEKLIACLRTPNDEPVPSGPSAACHVLLRLGALCDEGGYAEAADRALVKCRSMFAQSPSAGAHMLGAALRQLSEPHEFAIVGLEAEAAAAMLAVVDEFYLPHLVRVGAASGEAGDLAAEVPLLRGRTAQGGRPTAYVCSGGACREPVQEPGRLREQLAALLPRR